MDNTSTVITYEKVTNDANNIKDCATVMNNIFSDFEAAMNRVGTDDVFDGQASETLNQNFANLKKRFDEYIKLVNSFADTILNASESTANVEQNLANQASELANQ